MPIDIIFDGVTNPSAEFISNWNHAINLGNFEVRGYPFTNFTAPVVYTNVISSETRRAVKRFNLYSSTKGNPGWLEKVPDYPPDWLWPVMCLIVLFVLGLFIFYRVSQKSIDETTKRIYGPDA